MMETLILQSLECIGCIATIESRLVSQSSFIHRESEHPSHCLLMQYRVYSCTCHRPSYLCSLSRVHILLQLYKFIQINLENIMIYSHKHDMSLWLSYQTLPPHPFEAPEAASPGGASVASRVSLGEAAGLATEAANLGKLGKQTTKTAGWWFFLVVWNTLLHQKPGLVCFFPKLACFV